MDKLKIPIMVIVCPLHRKNMSLLACSRCTFYKGIDGDGVTCGWRVGKEHAEGI